METKDESQKEIYAVRLAKANRTAMNCHLITVSVLTLAYLAEVFKGAKSVQYWLTLAFLGLGPVALEFFFYHRNKTHFMIKHIVPFGYAAMYIMIIFTTDNAMAFVYIMPMLIAVTVYNDFRFDWQVGAAVVLVNVIHVIYFYGKGGFEPVEISSAEIQIASLVVVIIFSCYTAKVSYKMNHVEIERAESEKNRSGQLLEKTLQVSSDMTQVIGAVSGETAMLLESIQSTQTAMNELTGGTHDTAEAVQQQLTQTEAIAEKIGQVKEASGQIADNMRETQGAIQTGNGHIDYLVNQVSQTEQMNVRVAEELGQLKEDMTQMFSILEMINGITSQTSLLSLNASIEAARAGEAGRGFAVVATEISALASQTQDATVKIEKQIKNVSSEIGEMVSIIEDMIGQVEKQNEAVGETAQSFERIAANAENIDRNSTSLSRIVEELEKANYAIADSIQTISAISEEVAAHATSTYTSCAENEKTIERLTDKAEDLTKLAERLNG